MDYFKAIKTRLGAWDITHLVNIDLNASLKTCIWTPQHKCVSLAWCESGSKTDGSLELDGQPV